MSDALLHRDDLDFPVVEELTKHLQELDPGVKVVFAGDMTEVPAEVRDAARQLELAMARSLVEGFCFDCGRKAPGEWGPDHPDTDLPDGWGYYSNEKVAFIVCPDCDREEGGSADDPEPKEPTPQVR